MVRRAIRNGLVRVCGAAVCVVVATSGGVVAAEPTEAEVASDTVEARDYSDFRYGLTVQEYQEIVERLGLDDEQRSIVDAMHDELRRERFAAEEEYREARADLEAWRGSMRDGTGPEDRRERLRLYTAIVKRLNSSYRVFIDGDIERAETFLADVRLVLRPEQIDDFEAALRWRIRHRQLRWGALPYTRVDLVAITQEMAEAGELVLDRDRFGDASKELFEAALLGYEKELDRQLRLLIEIEADEPNGARAQGRTTRVRDFDDPEDRERWRARFGEASVRLGELQKRHAGLVGYYLTASSRDRLESILLGHAYPTTARSSGPEELIERLLALDETSQVQREQIERFFDEYRLERASADRSYLQAVDALVATGDPRVTASFEPMRNGWRFGAEIAEGVLVQEAYRARRLLDNRWSGRIWNYGVEQGLVAREKVVPSQYTKYP